MGQATNFQHLQKLMLEAIFDETALQPALREFARLCGAPISQLMVAQRNRTLIRSSFSIELDADIGPTEAMYQDINPRVIATPFMVQGKATRDKDFISYDRIHKDQTYQELILPAGLGHFSGVPVIHNSEMTAGIALHRRITDAAFNDEEARLHEMASAVCAPVLEFASLIESQNVRSTVDLFGKTKAVAILDYSGRIRDNNQMFERMLKAVAARIDRTRKLVLESEADRKALRSGLGNHLGIVGGAFVLTSKARSEKWLCRLYPKPAFTVVGPEAGHALLVAEQIDRPLVLNIDLIQQVFDFTPTEGVIANALFQGKSVRDISVDRDISVETVRSHIKSILQKTETNRQAELVAKLARFVDHSGA